MNRFSARVFTGVALAACAGAIMPACAHDDSTLFIRSVQAPSASGGVCTYVPDPSQPTLFFGTLDGAFTTRYEAVLLVGNQMTPQGDPVQARTETSRIELQYAVVHVTDAAGNQLAGPGGAGYTTVTAGTVDPATGADPDYTTVAVEAIDPGTVLKFLPKDLGGGGGAGLPQGDAVVQLGGAAQQLITYIQLFGQTLGGQNVSSNVFEFPVSICVGCLLQGLVGTSCPATQTNTVALPCNIGQDLQVSCLDCEQDICQCGALTCNGSNMEPPPADAGPG